MFKSLKLPQVCCDYRFIMLLYNVEAVLDTRLFLLLNYIPDTCLREMVAFWSVEIPACLWTSHWFESIVFPAASLNLMNPEQHRKGIENTRSPLNKRLHEAFIDLAEEIAESLKLHWWFRDALFTRVCSFLQVVFPGVLHSAGMLCNCSQWRQMSVFTSPPLPCLICPISSDSPSTSNWPQ